MWEMLTNVIRKVTFCVTTESAVSVAGTVTEDAGGGLAAVAWGFGLWVLLMGSCNWCICGHKFPLAFSRHPWDETSTTKPHQLPEPSLKMFFAISNSLITFTTFAQCQLKNSSGQNCYACLHSSILHIFSTEFQGVFGWLISFKDPISSRIPLSCAKLTIAWPQIDRLTWDTCLTFQHVTRTHQVFQIFLVFLPVSFKDPIMSQIPLSQTKLTIARPHIDRSTWDTCFTFRHVSRTHQVFQLLSLSWCLLLLSKPLCFLLCAAMSNKHP